MKAILDGLVYDTREATLIGKVEIADTESTAGVSITVEALWRTDDGRFFVHFEHAPQRLVEIEGVTFRQSLVPVDAAAAQEWLDARIDLMREAGDYMAAPSSVTDP